MTITPQARGPRRALLAAAVCLCALAACGPGETRFDTVVLVTIDTLRADHVGSYGYPRPTTPFLDTLAAGGLRFSHAVSSMPHTAPAHASILTGLEPAQHQVLANGMDLERSVPSLASLLRSHGFDTAAFVSVDFLGGIGHGFDHFDREIDHKPPYRPADQTTSAALDWLAQRRSTRPLFLWVHFYDPHEHADNVPIPEDSLRLMEGDFDARRDSLLELLRTTHGWDAAPDPERIGLLNRYDAQVAHADTALAALHRAVEERERGRRTLWVVTSDHGEGLGDHGFVGHGRFLFGEHMRVPLVVASSSGWWKPGVVEALVRHVDLLPTLADLLGIELDVARLRLEGSSLAALIDDPAARAPFDHAFYQRRPADPHRQRWGWESGIVAGVETAGAKYIWRSEGQGELYDLRNDPYELVNQIGSGSPDEARLHRLLARDLRRVTEDHRVDPKGQFIDERYNEDLKALGYL